MSEDEIGEIRDELRVYKDQLDELRADFKLLVHYSDVARGQIKLVADGGGIRTDPALVEGCERFAKKYSLWLITGLFI